jgi:hypothetical protein
MFWFWYYTWIIIGAAADHRTITTRTCSDRIVRPNVRLANSINGAFGV